ncbi:DUF4102 domain-containing protein [Massilia sp. RP-1-19]|uniref:DUF4102 domain-containing protein n=1 Tax=Massilia polaris TaxID=2728846 RepID=A0A848HR48_9BURK|nr:Arm DNA-binding domain-containing protein [Massilia polaris]NML63574.1 DUF4102 domain-containing protein [Massilia polaris]
MAIVLEKLKALTISKLQEPGYYGDGGGLWLQVSKTGTKSWIFRYTMDKKQREMGLGSFLVIGLADARERAKACRLLVLDGVDPLDERAARKQQLATAGQADHLRPVCETLCRCTPRWLEKFKTCRPMGEHVGNLCVAGDRKPVSGPG